MKKIAALIALAGITFAASAQHTRNALVYGARAVGDVAWNFGSFTIDGLVTNDSVTFEIAVFADWQTGAGFSAATYKTYIDCNIATDSIAIIDDPSNGATPNDGRQGVFSYTAATQKVFTTRGADVGGSGFRLSSSANTAPDAGPTGGMFFNQSTPVGNPNFNTDDHVLGYRFNVTLSRSGGTTLETRTALIHTPFSRVGGFTTYNSLTSGSSTEYLKANLALDTINLTAHWVPTPSALAFLGLGGLCAARRRR